MRAFFSKFPSIRRRSNTEVTVNLVAKYLKNPHHRWILKEKRFRDTVILFLSQIPERYLRVMIQKNVLLVYSSGRMSCTFYQYKNCEIILVFPDLYKMLLSANRTHGFAILAHEVGHVIHQHSHREVSAIDAQLEADLFAWELGFGSDLLKVLQLEKPSTELATRLICLASRLHT